MNYDYELAEPLRLFQHQSSKVFLETMITNQLNSKGPSDPDGTAVILSWIYDFLLGLSPHPGETGVSLSPV